MKNFKKSTILFAVLVFSCGFFQLQGIELKFAKEKPKKKSRFYIKLAKKIEKLTVKKEIVGENLVERPKDDLYAVFNEVYTKKDEDPYFLASLKECEVEDCPMNRYGIEKRKEEWLTKENRYGLTFISWTNPKLYDYQFVQSVGVYLPTMKFTRELAENYLALDADKTFTDKDTPLVYADFGSNGLKQVFFNILKLRKMGFKNFELHLIDGNYKDTIKNLAELSTTEISDVSKYDDYIQACYALMKWFTSEKNVTMKIFLWDSVSDYVQECKKNNERKAHIISSFDTIIIGKQYTIFKDFKILVDEGSRKDGKFYVLHTTFYIGKKRGNFISFDAWEVQGKWEKLPWGKIPVALTSVSFIRKKPKDYDSSDNIMKWGLN